MNNRPRKCLGYKTPFEVLAGQIKVDESYFGARRVKGRRGMVPEVKY
jgi:hypothetical protein